MNNCAEKICVNCTCGRLNLRVKTVMAANANYEKSGKPKQIVRRNPRDAALNAEMRFKESMKILA